MALINIVVLLAIIAGTALTLAALYVFICVTAFVFLYTDWRDND